MKSEDWEELATQVEEHGPEKIEFEMQTDDGNGVVWVDRVMYENGVIKVLLS